MIRGRLKLFRLEPSKTFANEGHPIRLRSEQALPKFNSPDLIFARRGNRVFLNNN